MCTYRTLCGVLCAIAFLWGTTALAVQPLEITDAFTTEEAAHGQIAVPHQHLVVLGVNFLNGGDIELTLGTFPLEVISQTDTEVVAELPSIIAPGSYQLAATTGGGTVRHDDFDGVTIGAVGPEGPQGPQGTIGLPGPAGQVGAPGQDGAPGADGSSCSASQGIGSAIVSCTDGTSATVFDGSNGADGLPGMPGADGADGQDGTPCSVTKIGDTATIDCASNGIVNVYDGAPGQQGPQGEQGPPGAGFNLYFVRFRADSTETALLSPQTYLAVSASCDPGDVAISGAFNRFLFQSYLKDFSSQLFDNKYIVFIEHESDLAAIRGLDWVCADVSAPHRSTLERVGAFCRANNNGQARDTGWACSTL